MNFNYHSICHLSYKINSEYYLIVHQNWRLMGNLRSKNQVSISHLNQSKSESPDVPKQVKPVKFYPQFSTGFEEEKGIEKFTKQGVKAHPRMRLLLATTGSLAIQKILRFLQRNRVRISQLKGLTTRIDILGIIPLLMTRVSIKPFIKKLGNKLTSFRHLQQAKIGRSQTDMLSVEETLIQSLSRLRKIKRLALEIPDIHSKIHFIGRKLPKFKGLNELNLNFFSGKECINPVIMSLKWLSNLKTLSIDLSECHVDGEMLEKLGTIMLKMRNLESAQINLGYTEVNNDDVQDFINMLKLHIRLCALRIKLKGCQNISWFFKLNIMVKGNLLNTSKLC